LINQDPPRRRIALLVPRLGSSFDGEIIATAKAIERIMTAEGRDWHWLADVIREPVKVTTQGPQHSAGSNNVPMTDWRSVVRFCQLYGVGSLSEKDIHFIDNLSMLRPQRLSQRQAEWLGDIASRLGMRRSA